MGQHAADFLRMRLSKYALKNVPGFAPVLSGANRSDSHSTSPDVQFARVRKEE